MTIAVTAMARPAQPGPVVITGSDGTEHIVYLHGDEFFHYMTTADGQWVEMQDGLLKTVPALSEHEVTLRREQRRVMVTPRHITEAALIEQPLNIAPRGLIILAQFSDLSFQAENNLAGFTAMFNSETYSYNGATGSAKRYFEDQSFGQYSPQFDVVGPVTVSRNQAYYGQNDRSGNDTHAADLIIEACQIADTAFGVDFTKYDNNNDGIIDFVYVVYAGRGEADGGASSTIWPHTSWIYSDPYAGQTIRLDGKILDTYACSNELHIVLGYGLTRDGIGAFCHEFTHVLGLPDHYATNNSTAKVTGDWDIMCSGSYNNNSNTPAGYTAYERFFLGWITPVLLNEPVTIDSMQPLNTSGETYIITETGESNLIGNDPNPTTFFLLENRQQTGWDTYIPGHGMLITKIAYNYYKWANNTVNNSASSMGYDIIEADGKAPSIYDTGGSGKQGDAFPCVTANSYSPYEQYPITQIKENGNTIFFNFMGGYDAPATIAKASALEQYGEDYTDIVGVYDPSGRLIFTEGKLNSLAPGTYIVAFSNGKKHKGIKLVIR